MSRDPRESPRTLAVHAGNRRPRPLGSAVLPIHQSTVFELGDDGEVLYVRYGNLPEHRGLERLVAELEGAEAGLVLGSGMAAIVAAVLGLCKAGDVVLVDRSPYGGTWQLVERWLPRWGIEGRFVDATDSGTWSEAPPERTRMLLLESISNPLLRIPDLGAAAAWADRHGVTTLVDNTFATPINFRPIEHGVDLVVHSATKYLNGHSDLVAGVVVGDAERIEGIRDAHRILGASLDPHVCFLLARGARTLALRVAAQNATAAELADRLAVHPSVRSIRYPGREDHPEHERARELFDGFGGMLAFELGGGLDAVDRFLDGLSLVTPAPSLGGVETLAVSPARTSHAALEPAERNRLGIVDGLVRMSVGIEDVDDLWRDLERALGSAS